MAIYEKFSDEKNILVIFFIFYLKIFFFQYVLIST